MQVKVEGAPALLGLAGGMLGDLNKVRRVAYCTFIFFLVTFYLPLGMSASSSPHCLQDGFPEYAVGVKGQNVGELCTTSSLCNVRVVYTNFTAVADKEIQEEFPPQYSEEWVSRFCMRVCMDAR